MPENSFRSRSLSSLAFFIAIIIASFLVSACAPTEQVTRVEQNQSQLEYRLNQIQTDINNIKKQNYAALVAKMDQIKVQMSELNGRLEKQEYLQSNTDKKIAELERYLKIQSERINDLITDVQRVARKSGVKNLASRPLPPWPETATPTATSVLPYAISTEPTSQPEAGTSTVTAPAASPAPPVSTAPAVLTPEQEYKRAFQLFNNGKYEEARQAFEEFLKKYPDSKLAGNAQFWIGECYYKQKNYQEAINAYQIVLDKYPNGNKIKDSMLKQGMAFANIGDTTAARILFSRLIKNFPDSNQAMIAKKKMEKLAKGKP
ncbi:MAG: tol-pal system protein YbgF [Deltaproteobacteria bacterium]|nr:MAG: tol-pal system protein YbgF [Deltaproteobacteria bacterium]